MIDQEQNRMNRNPYQPTVIESTKPLNGIRWLRRFVILNCLILSVPLVCALAAYLILEANGVHLSGVSGAMGTELVIMFLVYLAMPNSIMVALWLSSRRSSSQKNGSN